MIELKLVGVGESRKFYTKPLTQLESDKALSVGEPVKVELDTGSADDPRQKVCNAKIAKAIAMVQDKPHFDHAIQMGMVKAAQEWFTHNSDNGRAKLNQEDAASLIVRLYRIEPLPVRLGTITPRVMNPQEWKEYTATLEEKVCGDCCD